MLFCYKWWWLCSIWECLFSHIYFVCRINHRPVSKCMQLLYISPVQIYSVGEVLRLIHCYITRHVHLKSFICVTCGKFSVNVIILFAQNMNTGGTQRRGHCPMLLDPSWSIYIESYSRDLNPVPWILQGLVIIGSIRAIITDNPVYLWKNTKRGADTRKAGVQINRHCKIPLDKFRLWYAV